MGVHASNPTLIFAMKMTVHAVMAVALVAAIAHSLPHASMDAIVPEPDFYETAGVVKAQHLPAPDAVLAEVEFPKGMGSNPGAAAAELLATGSRSDMHYPSHFGHKSSSKSAGSALGSETELLATGSGSETELLATGSGSAAPDCDKCIHEFATDGGCDAWKKQDWDAVHAAVPPGCYPCGDEAAQHCGVDSAMGFLEAMQTIDNKN